MSAEIIARAFDPFFTTKPIGEGTGLGLSMVWGFAGQSGGGVNILSELGRGSTVSIYLPRGADQIAAVKGSPTETEASPLPHRTILLVDDEPLIRMGTADKLHELGYVVIETGDAAGALKIIGSGQAIDLLLTDVGLPNGMNGRQLAGVVRDKIPNLPVLFITGYAESAVLNQGHLASAMEVLAKPFDMQTLAKRVRDLIEQN